MSNERIRELLATLNQELERTAVDAETRELMKSLDTDIHARLGGGDQQDEPSLLDRAKQMETRFAVDHPVAGQALREVINILNRIGI